MVKNTNRQYVNHDGAGLRSYADAARFAHCDIAEVREAAKLATWEWRKQGTSMARKWWTVTDGETAASDWSKYFAIAHFVMKRKAGEFQR